jgi:hypothetical protein
MNEAEIREKRREKIMKRSNNNPIVPDLQE